MKNNSYMELFRMVMYRNVCSSSDGVRLMASI